MYGCESWTVKKAERRRIDAFELWCWRRLLRVPWTARRSNQWRRSALGVLWKDWGWSWNSNTLATSWEELTHWKRLWYWEGLGAGGERDDWGWDCWMASRTRWTWVWVSSGSWWWAGRLRFMGSQRVGHDWATELNWTEANSQLIGKLPDAGKDWRQEKRVSENKKAWGHCWCNEHELGQTSGDGEGQGGLECFHPWTKGWTHLDSWTTATFLRHLGHCV